MITAAADGSSLSNPGPAGWAWYINDDIWAAGGWEHGTNNMGELMAVLDLLQSTAHTGESLRILCDSQYVINSLTKWLPGWKRRGWRKGDGKPVLNVDLMKELDKALAGRDVEFKWVKGHSGHPMNEAADERARAAAAAFRDGVAPDEGPGYPEADTAGRDQEFFQGQVDEQPDLFSVPADQLAEPPAEATPGTASPRIKSQLRSLHRELAKAATDGDKEALERLLHPEFTSHGSWEPTSKTFETLGVDRYAEQVAGMRVQQEGNLSFYLWQRVGSAWKLRFAQSTSA